MIRHAVLVLVGVMALVESRADNTNLTGVGDARVAVWTVTPSTNAPGDLHLTVECSGLSAMLVQGGVSLRIPGQASSAKPGTPDLPRLAKLLPARKGAKAVLVFLGSNPTNLSDVVVAPAVGFKLEALEGAQRVLCPYRQPDPAVYGIDQYWPAELGRLDAASIGTQIVVRVECCPVQYNPITKSIRFFRRLEGELRFEPAPWAR